MSGNLISASTAGSRSPSAQWLLLCWGEEPGLQASESVVLWGMVSSVAHQPNCGHTGWDWSSRCLLLIPSGYPNRKKDHSSAPGAAEPSASWAHWAEEASSPDKTISLLPRVGASEDAGLPSSVGLDKTLSRKSWHAFEIIFKKWDFIIFQTPASLLVHLVSQPEPLHGKWGGVRH